MPLEATPRSLPFLICMPFGRCELCSATGTRRAHEHIVRARHDLHRFLLSDIDLTNLQFVRVGVLFQRHDAAPATTMGDVLPRADHILHGVAVMMSASTSVCRSVSIST